MNRHSILFKISIFFILALLASTLLFKTMYDYKFQSEKEILHIHYHHIVMSIMKWKIGDSTYEDFLTNITKKNIQIIDNKELYKNIQKLPLFDTISCAKGKFPVYLYKEHRYIFVPESIKKVLLKDKHTESINVTYIWWIYLSFVCIMFLLYLSILISLRPLKKLREQIQSFGNGDTSINFNSDKKDEIAEVSNEFSNTAKKINDLINARIIFMRNISHEFKTPITNGFLALEFIEASTSKHILKNVFTRLDLLLKEFVQIEEVTITNDKLECKEYTYSNILDQASDMLFLETGSIKNNFHKESVKVNFELFSIVFKNLIDNGIKYTDNDDFYIEYINEEIHFCSRGEILDETLEYYCQPFRKSKTKSFDSFGLGLYIVATILQKHAFTFSYTYKDGYNHFIIKTNPQKYFINN